MRALPVLAAVITMTNAFLIPITKSSTQLSKRLPITTLFVSDQVEEIQMDAEERMAKSIDSVKQNLGTIRTGRASANMLDRVSVDYYGVPTPIFQMATISVPSAQQLTISPFDKKT